MSLNRKVNPVWLSISRATSRNVASDTRMESRCATTFACNCKVVNNINATKNFILKIDCNKFPLIQKAYFFFFFINL